MTLTMIKVSCPVLGMCDLGIDSDPCTHFALHSESDFLSLIETMACFLPAHLLNVPARRIRDPPCRVCIGNHNLTEMPICDEYVHAHMHICQTIKDSPEFSILLHGLQGG